MTAIRFGESQGHQLDLEKKMPYNFTWRKSWPSTWRKTESHAPNLIQRVMAINLIGRNSWLTIPLEKSHSLIRRKSCPSTWRKSWPSTWRKSCPSSWFWERFNGPKFDLGESHGHPLDSDQLMAIKSIRKYIFFDHLILQVSAITAIVVVS